MFEIADHLNACHAVLAAPALAAAPDPPAVAAAAADAIVARVAELPELPAHMRTRLYLHSLSLLSFVLLLLSFC